MCDAFTEVRCLVWGVVITVRTPSRAMSKRKFVQDESPTAQGGHVRNVLIAGGTDGIGFAFLRSECQRDKYSTMFVLGRDFARVDADLTAFVESQRIVKLRCDITDVYAVRQQLKSVHWIDDFVNTIGTFARGPVTAMSDEDVSQHFTVNCVANINLTRAVLPMMLRDDEAAVKADMPRSATSALGAQILVCGASLALQARSPYALQSATKAGLKYFVDALRIELKGKVRVMSILPPSVDTNIFAKAGDQRDTSGYPPASRVADAMRFMLDCPPDVCIPELLLEQHQYAV